MAGQLFVVGIPIGNLAELTPRAAETLASADIIACEDTRYTGLLMQHIGAKKKLVSCHKFNERSRVESLIGELLSGNNIALVSDAGTPCISDPGHLLVAAACEAGIEVVGISGSCAVTLAMSVSGFPADSFVFWGFLPRGRKEICAKVTNAMSGGTAARSFGTSETGGGVTAVFYESPKRIMSTLETLGEIDGIEKLCLCNDLTKPYERIYRGGVCDVLEELRGNPNHEKGEYTGVLYLSRRVAGEDTFSIEARLIDIMVKSHCTLRDAMERLDAPRNEIYRASLHLKEISSL